MSTTAVQDDLSQSLRTKFNERVEEIAAKIRVTNVKPDRQLQCDLSWSGLTTDEINSLRRNLSSRSDLGRITFDGWLKIDYKPNSLHGDKLQKFVDRVSDAVKREIARKIAKREFPQLKPHHDH